ncbi:MAG: glycosyltransferase family 2 protein [Alphaproteobacteria bacterium]|nr:glycosyltransferase family 2 protein [Alphaproteobacteria bacterium]
MFNKRNIITILLTVFLVYGSYFGYDFYRRLHPKVSIILPVYNGEKQLRNTIPMLLASDLTDFEFIIVDDASTDKTWEILQEFAAQDNRIRIFHNEKNLGISGNRNKGISLARGKYFAMMDHDDTSLPARLKVSADYLDAHPDIAIVDVGTILQLAYEKGFKRERAHILDFLLSEQKKSTNIFTEAEKDENIKIALMYSLGVPTQSAAMVRRSFLEEHHLKYRENIVGSDDYYLYVDMAILGAGFHHIPDILHIYNDEPHHTEKFNTTQIEESKNARRLLYEWVGLDYNQYSTLEDTLPEREFVCLMLKDLIVANRQSKRFTQSLVEKDYKVICEE